ncbi:hypothetical protein QF042_001669 [Pedobacter sp. W3I1]|nr:hypothetical protein [Pedobacter sp. W3I1]
MNADKQVTKLICLNTKKQPSYGLLFIIGRHPEFISGSISL